MERPRYYILDDENNVVVVDDVLVWGEWFETAWPRRRVAQTEIRDGAYVSTVFLGLDHRFGAPGPPLVFESMAFTARSEVRFSVIFGREVEGHGEELDCERCATWGQALMQHERMVEKWAKARLDS